MILVTGATGHIGNVLVRELLARGKAVRALVLPGEDRHPLEGLQVEWMEGDVLDLASLERAMQGVDQVFHLAGIISIKSGKDALVRRVNLDGTRNILRAMRACRVTRLVHTSSIHAFRDAPLDEQMDERQPFDPANARGEYDRSKAEATLEVLEAAREGMHAVIVCPTGVIGPFDYRGSEMGRVLLDCDREAPQFYIDGGYDFVDVRDVAQGMILAGERGRRGECYILSGERVTILDMIQAVRKVTGRPVRAVWLPLFLAHLASWLTPVYYTLTRTRPVFTRYALATLLSNSNISSAKARRELGFTTRPAAESIADTVKWFRKR